MVQIYCGEGKGKTTASVGLSVRAAGRGLRVVFAQFLKSGDSGERTVLAGLPSVTLLEVPEQMKFTFAMEPAERQAEAVRQTELLRQAAGLAGQADVLVLDELCAALNRGMVPQDEVTALLDGCPASLEVVITGREPPQALVERADYITEMKKIRHPFDRGIRARPGIEW